MATDNWMAVQVSDDEAHVVTNDRARLCVATGLTPRHAELLASAPVLQARLAEAERLLTGLTRDGFTLREEFWGAVKDARAFLKGVDNG